LAEKETAHRRLTMGTSLTVGGHFVGSGTALNGLISCAVVAGTPPRQWRAVGLVKLISRTKETHPKRWAACEVSHSRAGGNPEEATISQQTDHG